MGANMQRQAVPTRSEAPVVGTEHGSTQHWTPVTPREKPGVVSSVDAKAVSKARNDGALCLPDHEVRTRVTAQPARCGESQRVEYRDVIADGPFTTAASWHR